MQINTAHIWRNTIFVKKNKTILWHSAKHPAIPPVLKPKKVKYKVYRKLQTHPFEALCKFRV